MTLAKPAVSAYTSGCEAFRLGSDYHQSSIYHYFKIIRSGQEIPQEQKGHSSTHWHQVFDLQSVLLNLSLCASWKTSHLCLSFIFSYSSVFFLMSSPFHLKSLTGRKRRSKSHYLGTKGRFMFVCFCLFFNLYHSLLQSVNFLLVETTPTFNSHSWSHWVKKNLFIWKTIIQLLNTLTFFLQKALFFFNPINHCLTHHSVCIKKSLQE